MLLVHTQESRRNERREIEGSERGKEQNRKTMSKQVLQYVNTAQRSLAVSAGSINQKNAAAVSFFVCLFVGRQKDLLASAVVLGQQRVPVDRLLALVLLDDGDDALRHARAPAVDVRRPEVGGAVGHGKV